MCRIVIQAIEEGNEQVIEDVKRIAKYKDEVPKMAQELFSQIFTTICMGMKNQSSRETRQRAKDLAAAIGSYHVDLDIDDVYNGVFHELDLRRVDKLPELRTDFQPSPEEPCYQLDQFRTPVPR